MSQNLQFAGRNDGDGNVENRWPQLVERIKQVTPSPDFLMIQEAWNWEKFGHKYLAAAVDELSMDALPLPPSNSGNGTALLYKKQRVAHWKRWNTDHSSPTLHGFGVAAFDIGLSSLLSVMSVHATPFSSDMALEEIGLITTRAYKYGPLAVIGGDCNYPPARGPEPNYSTMKPYNIAARTLLSDPATDSPLTPDRRQAWKLEQAGFVDVAYHLYEKTGDESLLQHTATDDRIDQFWVSQPLAPAIINYWVVDKPETASDHKGIVFQLDTQLIELQA